MATPNPVLIDAIRSHLRVTFRYKSNDEAEPTTRVVEPWIYGLRNGKQALYGFQIEGGNGQGLKRFNLEKVKNIQLTAEFVENHPPVDGAIIKWEEIFAAWQPKTEVKAA